MVLDTMEGEPEERWRVASVRGRRDDHGGIRGCLAQHTNKNQSSGWGIGRMAECSVLDEMYARSYEWLTNDSHGGQSSLRRAHAKVTEHGSFDPLGENTAGVVAESLEGQLGNKPRPGRNRERPTTRYAAAQGKLNYPRARRPTHSCSTLAVGRPTLSREDGREPGDGVASAASASVQT